MTIETQLLPELGNLFVGRVVLLNGFDRRGLVVITRDGAGLAARPSASGVVHRRQMGCDGRIRGSRRRVRGGWPARAWPIPRVSAWRLARRTR
ncbi:hypothetical protein ACFO1B_16080 [Dactylosporangium siamense]|uniref:Uncharacterized protein n=1 Tax=Dactylosporangium siamense TaxID=685454 RepID=A0A919PJZ9_9ACTN|nr:hypothetical protein [Dactylosporangium siamense]GIG45359.1 hypothetical protein Dsi01nite_034000 [Dactylosporangium siamense]